MTANLNTGGLPATDNLGWSNVVPTLTAIQTGLVVTLAGQLVRLVLIRELFIELDDRGGYKSATMALDRDVGLASVPMMSELHVTYQGHNLFLGTMESCGPSYGDSMTVTMTFTGPIRLLEHHRGFHRTYVDSDLAAWQTGQGANTSANVFEVEAS